jgi:hypothetical protein
MRSGGLNLTLAQGNALGLYRKMNESPERAGQPTPQSRIGIGTPLQGFPRALPWDTKVGTPLRGLVKLVWKLSRMRRSP